MTLDYLFEGSKKNCDDSVHTYNCKNEKEAKLHIDKVLKNLKEFADSGYFDGNKEETVEIIEENVYIF